MSSQSVSIPEEPDDNNMDLESNCELGAESVIQPPADFKDANNTFNGEMSSSAGNTSQNDPSVKPKPVPKPRSFKIAVQDVGADDLKSIQSPTSPHVKNPLSPSSLPPSPSQAGLAGSPLRQESQESESLVVKGPPSLNIPAPPPLPFKDTSLKVKSCTKAFHWDLVGYEKVKGHHFTNTYLVTCFPNHFTFHDWQKMSWQIAKSFWVQENTSKIEISTSRLLEQFAVKTLGTFGAVDQSNSQQIMLNQKIAHNFSKWFNYSILVHEF